MRQVLGTIFAAGAVAVLITVILRKRASNKWKRLPPGPTPWPIVGSLGEVEKISHQGFANISKKFGSPLIHLWLGSVHLVVANSVDTAKEILKVQDMNFASRPRITQFVELAYDNQTISMAPHGRVWRHLRKVLVLELLTFKRIQEFKVRRIASKSGEENSHLCARYKCMAFRSLLIFIHISVQVSSTDFTWSDMHFSI